MATTRKTAASPAPREDPAVLAFLEKLEHPCRDEIIAMHALIMGVDRSIGDGIKWNSASFRTTEFFATINLRYKEGVQVVLHRGARARRAVAKLDVADPEELLEWRDKDRALLSVPAGELARRRKSVQSIIRGWIRHV